MEIGLLIIATLGITLQNVTKKIYNSKGPGKKTLTFSMFSCTFACLFFILTSGFDLDFNVAVLPYSLGFGASYGSAVIFSLLAIMTGPLSLSVLISSYSLMIPTVYGLLFLNEEASAWFYVGLGFLAISLFLINFKPKDTHNSASVKITPVWLLFVFLAFLGNGVCSTVQAVQQKNFGGAYKSEFMIMALLIVITVVAVMVAFTERESFLPAVKGGGYLMAICGIANGACNLFVMILATRMNASLMYPLISAGSIIFSSLVSIFIYKEKLSKLQYMGLILGICAVVFMNI